MSKKNLALVGVLILASTIVFVVSISYAQRPAGPKRTPPPPPPPMPTPVTQQVIEGVPTPTVTPSALADPSEMETPPRVKPTPYYDIVEDRTLPGSSPKNTIAINIRTADDKKKRILINVDLNKPLDVESLLNDGDTLLNVAFPRSRGQPPKQSKEELQKLWEESQKQIQEDR
jgi:hypothetical protein